MLVYAGTFTSVSHNIIPDRTRQVVLGDLDNDNYLDLVEGNGMFTRFTPNKIYLNDESGNFIWNQNTSESDLTASVAVGDLDNDEDLDYIAGNTDQKNKIYLNDGNGNFVLNQSSSENDVTWSVAVGDLDNDGDLDYIAGNDGVNSVYLNNNGDFVLHQNSTEIDKTYSIAIGDLDNDGDLDYIAGNTKFDSTFPNRIYLNNGSGFFTLHENNDIFEDNESDRTESIALGDFNNDGYLDYIIGNYGRENRVYLNDGNAHFILHLNSSESDLTTYVSVGDLDNDGDLDYIAGNTDQKNKIYLNDGNGNFVLNQSSSENDYTYSIAIGDIDNDFDLDYIDGVLSITYPDKVYKNNESDTNPNNAPSPPSSLNSIVNGREVILDWDDGSDTKTLINSLTYNLRVGTSENKNSIFSSVIPAGPGNIGHAFTKTIKNLESGEYYYSVQTIDSGFANSSFSTEKTFVIGKPTIDSYEPTDLTPSVDENSALEFNVSASDIDDDPLSYSWKLDGEEVLTDSSYDYEPDFDAAGEHTVIVIVSDGTYAVNQSWDVTVNNVNRAPVLDLINDVAVNETDLITITATASDPDNDPLTYSIDDPRFSQADSVFEWQTQLDDAGIYDVNISATDGLLTDSQIVTITVNDVVSFNISLNQGWNLISVPLILENKTLPSPFESIEGNYSSIFAHNGSEWKQYLPNNESISNLKEIDEKMGMWIKILNNDSLIISGTVPEVTTFNLKQGWNLIGYPSLNESNASVVFNDINASLINVLSYENNTWFGYSPLKPDELNSLKIIKPGLGYWINVNESVNLSIS